MFVPRRRASAIVLAAAALFSSACGDHGPSIVSPTLRAPTRAPSFTLNPGETLWDFVALAGSPDRALGQNTGTLFAQTGLGYIVASAASITVPPQPAFPQVTTKGFALSVGDEERGLGVCASIETAGDQCHGDEIGSDLTAIGLPGYFPALFLDFRNLAPGTTVDSITLASLQDKEGWLVLGSADGGATYYATPVTTGVAVDLNQVPHVTFPIPAGTNYLKIVEYQGGGGAGNDYVVQSVTTRTQVNLGNQGCTPGYWKQSQHFDSWPAAYTQNQLINTIFTIPTSISSLGTSTLLQGLNFQGGPGLSGKAQILLRAAISAALNSGSVAYGMSLTDIVNNVNAALAGGNLTTITDLGTLLDNLNNGVGGCPLN